MNAGQDFRITAPSWRAWRVWRRNRKQGMKRWHTTVLPPMLEPFLYLVAFGAGVGGLVGSLEYAGTPVDYVHYIAPALAVIAAMYQSYFETTYSSFVRMYYQMIWDAMAATPLNLGDILLGEAMWGATKGAFAGLVVLAVVSALGFVGLGQVWGLVLVILLTATLFSVLGLFFTALLPSIDAFNYPMFLFILPMFLFGETFFPVSTLPSWAEAAAAWTPLYNMMAVARPAALGFLVPGDLLHLVPWVVVVPALLFITHVLTSRRLID